MKSDSAFANGMAQDKALNDPSSSGWDSPFKMTDSKTPPIHGVLKVAGNTPTIVAAHLKKIKDFLGGTIVDVISPGSSVNGRVRDGKQKGHEQ